MWLYFMNKVKVGHQGEGHIKGKVKYLHLFKFYVTHTLCKQVVCIRLKCYLFRCLSAPGKYQLSTKFEVSISLTVEPADSINDDHKHDLSWLQGLIKAYCAKWAKTCWIGYIYLK